MEMQVNIPEGSIGSAVIEKFTVTKEELGLFNLRNPGRSMRPGTFTKLLINKRLVMSDTPAEQRDHMFAVRNAKGSVLINGLGIGMVVAACLKKPEVTDVTVIEINPDVIALVAPHLKSPKLTIINADALTWKPPKGKRYGMVWHDIWPDICGDNLPQMTTLKRRYGRRADWQGCWAEGECRRYSRHENRYGF